MFKSLKRKLIATTLAAAITAMSAMPAAAQAHLTFSFVNNSGWVLSGLFVDPSSSAAWGENILSRPLEFVGDAVEVSFSGYGETCLFDVAAQFTDGSYWYNTQFNFCSISEVTLEPENMWTWK